MADTRWPPFDDHDVITTSYDVITSDCGRQRRHLLTSYLIFIAFILAKLWRPGELKGGGGGGADGPRRHKKDRNNLLSNCFM